MDRTDSELIERCLEDESPVVGAFEELYGRYAPAVNGFLCALLRDRDRAEDVLQEAFFRAYSALDRFDRERRFRPWIFRIARNAALDALRELKKSREVASPEAELGRTEPDITSKSAAAAERRELVASALDSLPDEERSVLIMKHYEGLTAREIAEVLDCSLRTAKYRLKGAALLFGAELSRRSITSLEVI